MSRHAIYFLIIVTTVMSLVYTYLGRRLIRPARLRRPLKIAAWSAVYILLLILPLPLALRFWGFETDLIDAVSWVSYVSLGFVLLTLILVMIRDVSLLCVRVADRVTSALRKPKHDNPPPKRLIDSDRRRFLMNTSNMAILGLASPLAGYGFWEARRRPAVVEVSVPLDNLPPDLEGLRIAQITDIHAGPTVKRDWIQAVVDEVNRQKPDLVAVTGDLVDGTVSYLGHEVAPLADLIAPHGIFFVTGNHEYYSGVEPWIRELRRIGLTVLLNEHVTIQHGGAEMLLAGVTDYRGAQFSESHRSDPKIALAGARNGIPKILLAHQPMSIHAAAAAGYDLQLSGHTHGGQFFPGNFLARLAQPYLHGLHKHDNTWIYVSRGTGYWGPPLRIGQPSEITLITLRRSALPA